MPKLDTKKWMINYGKDSIKIEKVIVMDGHLKQDNYFCIVNDGSKNTMEVIGKEFLSKNRFFILLKLAFRLIFYYI